jgi:hypothetical protein
VSLVDILNSAICLNSSHCLSVRKSQTLDYWKSYAKAKIKRNLWKRCKSTGQDVDFAVHKNYSNDLKCELMDAR